MTLKWVALRHKEATMTRRSVQLVRSLLLIAVIGAYLGAMSASAQEHGDDVIIQGDNAGVVINDSNCPV